MAATCVIANAMAQNRSRKITGSLPMSLLRGVGLACVLIIIILSLLPGPERPHTGLTGQTEHVVAYSATAVFLGLGYQTRQARVAILLFLALLAATMELAQYWIPGRHSQIIDFVAGSVGASLGISLVAISDFLYQRRHRSTSQKGL
jgi:VanZ family protein